MANEAESENQQNSEVLPHSPLHPPRVQPPIEREQNHPQNLPSGIITEFTYSHQGQFPDPYTIQGYKKYAPEIVPVIIEETREEARHRREMEKLVKQGGVRRSIGGMNWAGVLGIAAIGGATYLGMHEEKEVALAVVGIPTFGFLAAFLTGTYSSRNERIEKAKIRHGQDESNSPEPPEEDEES